ncbi:hypothetical protein KR018_000300 [Drosophila ironensis]|nr:hypothetical protein KR018_000300 [Drosophila ironensis]
MFLNDLGQPAILESGIHYGLFEEHRGALLLSSAAFKDHVVPENWCQLVVGSEEDVFRLRSQENFTALYAKGCSFKTLRPNDPTPVEFDGSGMIVTLIPSGKGENGIDSRLYSVENGHTRFVILDGIPAHLDFLPKACGSFHRCLGQGIDVAYLDGDPLQEDRPNEALYALMHLLKPKHIHALRQKELPKWLLDLRQSQDLYA